MNKIRLISIAFISALLCVCCVKDLEVNVEFNAQSYEVSVGDTLNFASELKIENTKEVPVFSTSDETVAKFVSETVLMALEPGDVEVTATVAGKSATTNVHVNVVLAEKVLLEAPDSVLAASEQWNKVLAKVEPANYNYENLVWEFTPSSDSLKLTSNKVSANEYSFKVASYVEGGKVVVKVSDKNSAVSQTATIVVVKPATSEENPGDLEENPDSVQVAAKIVRLNAPDVITESDQTWGTVSAEVVAEDAGEYDYANLSWEFTPSDAEATGFAFEKVSDSQYNVRFTAYKEGANVVVKVTDKVGGRYATKTVAVAQKPVSGVTSIEVSPKTLSLFVGKTETLKANCTPSSYDQSLLIWETSDAKVVAVTNAGVVTAVAEGTAKVKVTDSVSGLSSECVITVAVPVTEVVVKRIVLDKTQLTLVAGEDSYQLVATCYDEQGNEIKDFGGLVWTASEDQDEDLRPFEPIEVSSQGLVTAKEVGASVVTVAVESNRSVEAKCHVTVTKKEIKVESMTLTPAEQTLDVNEGYDLMVKTTPDLSTVDNKTITFVSSNPEVATVSETGHVTGIAYGEAEITATSASGVTATAKVTVAELTGDEDEVTDFEILLTIDDEPTNANMTLPQFEKLKIKYAYTNGYIARNTRWEVDPSLAKVTAHEGYIEVEAIYDGMMSDAEKIPLKIIHYAGKQVAAKTVDIVRAMPKSIEFINLPENNTLYLGDRFPEGFRARVYPDQASQDVVYWGAVEVYSVANGTRPAYKTGYFTLSATAHYMGDAVSGVATSVDITVKAKAVEGGTLSNSTLILEEGKSANLEIDFTPAKNENYDYNVDWSSSDETVATVEKGKVTAHGKGNATISAKISNGSVLECKVTVIEPAPVVVSVGDYYYSDGTTSTELDASKTVIGVVFSVENPTQMGDTKLSANHREATHGLVVALEETANVVWQAEASNVGDWAVANPNLKYNYLQNTERMCGYSNTVALKAYNASCAPENKVLAVEHAPAIELGSTTSGWYLPSYAEWDMLYNYEKSTRASLRENGAIAKKIIAAGGTPFCMTQWNYDVPEDGIMDAPSYWASTETSGYESIAEWATCMHFLHGGQTNKFKHTKTYYIARYIFAF